MSLAVLWRVLGAIVDEGSLAKSLITLPLIPAIRGSAQRTLSSLALLYRPTAFARSGRRRARGVAPGRGTRRGSS